MNLAHARLRRTGLAVFAVALVVAAGVAAYRRWRTTPLPPTRIAEGTLYSGSTRLRAPAEDWPRWLGPRGDGISRETGLADTWPAGGPRLLWSAEVGLGYSSPVAVAGRVYLLTFTNGNEALTAFDADTGRILWSDEAAGAWSGSHPGTRATPIIRAGRIYTLGGSGDLTCRDLTTGKPVWRTNVLQAAEARNLRWGTSSPPLLDGDLIYVQAGEGGPTCLAIRAATGQVGWRSETRASAGYAPPVLVDVDGRRQLVVFGGDAVHGLDPGTGRTLWSEPWPTKEGVNASPPVYADGHLFVTSAEGQGAMILRLSPAAPPTRTWSSKQIQGYFQSPVLDQGHLYVNSLGRLSCVRFPSGDSVWTNDDASLRLNYGGSIVRLPDDRMLLMSARGRLSLATVTPAGVTILAQAQVVEGTEIYATPLVYGGRLYLKGMQNLTCYDLTNSVPTSGPASPKR